jgi:hypothetical protein
MADTVGREKILSQDLHWRFRSFLLPSLNPPALIPDADAGVN